jgi:hypothetical protein
MKIYLPRYKDSGLLPYSKVRKILDILELSSDFENDILQIRLKHNLPRNGVSEWNKQTISEAIDHFLNKESYTEQYQLRKKYRLPETWTESIFELIVFNAFIPPESSLKVEFNHLDDRFMNEHMGNFIKRDWVNIKFSEILSKKDLHKFIDNEWKNIEKFMFEHFMRPRTHRMMRFKLARDIIDLRDDKKKPFKEITEILSKNNLTIEEYDILNEDYVRQIYHRFKGRYLNK